MSEATYKYTLKADSGYKSESAGKISPERHGLVCAVLAGNLGDDLKVLLAAKDLLLALESALTILTDSVGDFDYDKAIAAIARAKGITQ